MVCDCEACHDVFNWGPLKTSSSLFSTLLLFSIDTVSGGRELRAWDVRAGVRRLFAAAGRKSGHQEGASRSSIPVSFLMGTPAVIPRLRVATVWVTPRCHSMMRSRE